MPINGGYKCSDGSYFSSRCEFFCSPGFSLKGQKTATCQHSKTWSAGVPTCVGKSHVICGLTRHNISSSYWDKGLRQRLFLITHGSLIDVCKNNRPEKQTWNDTRLSLLNRVWAENNSRAKQPAILPPADNTGAACRFILLSLHLSQHVLKKSSRFLRLMSHLAFCMALKIILSALFKESDVFK